MLTLTQSFDNKNEVDECGEHYIELVEAGEDASEALESAEESLHLVAPTIHHPVIFPRADAIALGWHDGNEAKVEGQLPCLVTFVGAIHEQVAGRGRRGPVFEQGAAFRCIS